MAKNPVGGPLRGRIVLDGIDPKAEPLRLTIHAVDGAGKVLESVPIEEDSFSVGDRVLDQASKFLVGPATAEPDARRTFYALSKDEMKRIVAANAELAIAAKIWQRWYLPRRCVSGNVRRCFPYLSVIDDLLVETGLAMLAGVRKLVGYRPLVRWPWRRCSPICFGTIEVYRRICCCTPPLVLEPPFDFPIDFRPFPPPLPPGDPWGPIGPRPGPDPAPFEVRELVLTSGTLDERKIQLTLAREALPKLSGTQRREFIARYPLLWCHCGLPQKVAQGFVQDGGTFSVCWREPFRFLLPNCREEFAYVVKQPIGGTLITIYDGVAANQWFGPSDQPTLTSYHHLAIGCRDSQVPGDGAFVVLEDIGTTPSYRLATPVQDSFQSVAGTDYNSGLLEPTSNPADAIGQLLNRNLGGNVGLQYHFTEPMKSVGAVYFRIQVAPANSFGQPAGSWTPLASPTWKTWLLNTAAPSSKSLGPHTQGGHSNLSKIPYDIGDPLGPNEEWQDGQFHGVIPTTDFPNGRYLVMVEVFNAAGTRLKPANAPGNEAGTVAGFTFRRWNVPASTDPVPFAALTHMLWWDNRHAEADIVDLRLGGVQSSEQCQFLEGSAGQTVQIGYRAYHPQPGTPSFLYYHRLRITRGLNGPFWDVANPPGAEVGEPPALPQTSVAKTLGDLLGDEPLGHQKCAFAVNLNAYVKTTNGAGTLTYLDAWAAAAFAAEIQGL